MKAQIEIPDSLIAAYPGFNWFVLVRDTINRVNINRANGNGHDGPQDLYWQVEKDPKRFVRGIVTITAHGTHLIRIGESVLNESDVLS